MGSWREVRERNTKLQTPSSREIPESKHQKPSSKHQRNPKFQAPNRGLRFELGASLEFGAWCLGPGASLELGVRDLVLFAWALADWLFCNHAADFPLPQTRLQWLTLRHLPCVSNDFTRRGIAGDGVTAFQNV